MDVVEPSWRILPSGHNACSGATLNLPLQEIPAWKETFYFWFMIGVGSITLPINMLTIFLLIKKSPFFDMEMRYLLINLQVQSSLQNAHLCFLFIPVLFPALGGGYCKGLLCVIGQSFHIGLTEFLLCLCLVTGAFSMLLFHRKQVLLPPTSSYTLGKRGKIVVYGSFHILLLSIPAIFAFSNSPMQIQQDFIDHCRFGFLTWNDRNLTWGIVVISKDSINFYALLVSLNVNLVVFGFITSFLLIYTIGIILKYSNKGVQNNARQRAKIINTLIVFSQLGLTVFLLVLPLALIMLQMPQQIPARTISRVLDLLCVFSMHSLFNGVLFLLGNKQYLRMFREFLKKHFNIGATITPVQRFSISSDEGRFANLIRLVQTRQFLSRISPFRRNSL